MRMREAHPSWAGFIVVVTLALLAGGGFTVIYVREALAKGCALILLQAKDDPPPVTDRGFDIQREAKALAREYDCKE